MRSRRRRPRDIGEGGSQDRAIMEPASNSSHRRCRYSKAQVHNVRYRAFVHMPSRWRPSVPRRHARDFPRAKAGDCERPTRRFRGTVASEEASRTLLVGEIEGFYRDRGIEGVLLSV